MTRFNRALWLSAAASVVFAMGCGGGGDTDAGTGSCTTDATCGTGKACHPVLKTCVSSCSGSSDCPSSEKTCAKINNSAASFCTCSTDALCAAATTGNICNGATRQCTAKCPANSCPSGFTCDTASGNCTGGGNTDAGTDAGVTTDGGVTCSSSNFEPDVCMYANVCYSDNRCDTASNDTACPNIAAAINGGNYTAWNPSSSTGPVIYNVTDDTDVNAGCTGAGDVAFTTTVYAYAGSVNFDANITAAVQLAYYTSTGAKRPINGVQVGNTANAWSSYTVSNGGKNAAVKMTLCAPAGTTSLTAGFAFSNGNAYCANLTRN